MRDYPNSKGQQKGEQPSGASDAPKKNLFYALRTRDDQEDSPDVVTRVLLIFAVDMYVLIDWCYFIFCYSLSSLKFDILPDVLHEPFVVST